MRVRLIKGADKGQIRDMGTMQARHALKSGAVEMVARDVCQKCGGLFEEVPTLKTEPDAYRCQVCGAPAVVPSVADQSVMAEDYSPESPPKPPVGRRSRRARAGADE